MHHVYICQFSSFDIANSSPLQHKKFHGIRAILFEGVKLCVSSSQCSKVLHYVNNIHFFPIVTNQCLEIWRLKLNHSTLHQHIVKLQGNKILEDLKMGTQVYR